MLKLRFTLWYWRSLGRLAIRARDVGQRCFTWYEQHSPMKIVTDGPKPCFFTRETCPYASLWHEADEGKWDGKIYATEAKP